MNNVPFYESRELICDISDFLSLLGNAGYHGNGKLLIQSHHLTDDFFNLKSGLAGEFLQKMSNYSIKAAIVLDQSHLEHPRFREMVSESNRQGLIVYFKDQNLAEAWLIE